MLKKRPREQSKGFCENPSLVVWAPNARGGGGRTSLPPLLSALAQHVQGRCVAISAPGALNEAPSADWQVLEVSGRFQRVKLELLAARWRQRGATVLAPLNFAPLAGADVVYQRNTLYFERPDGVHFSVFERAALRLRRTVALAQCRRTRIVVVPSEQMANLLVGRGITRSKIHVIPHGVPLGHLRQAEFEGSEAGTLNLLWVGVPTRQKNLQIVPLVLDSLRCMGVRAKLTITSHEDANEVTRLLGHEIDRLRLRDHLRFIGPVNHVDALELIGKADCLLMPSLTESFGLPVIEALGQGVPCVVSKGGALPQFVAYGATCAADWTPMSFAVAIVEASAPDARRSIDPAAVRATFSWSAHAAKLSALL